MKKKLLILLLSILAIALCVTACSKKDTEAAPVSIEVISSTVPTECAIGATLDFSTIKVNVHFDDGSITTVGFSDVTVGSIDTSTAGEKTVTVTYGSLSTTFTVTVKENASDVVVVITGIKIVPGSAPTSALLKKPYDTSTLQVEAIYSDGTKKMIPIEEVSVSSIDTSTAGEKTLTVSYLSFTDSMTVTVLNMTEVYVKSGTLVDKLFVGETLDTSNVVLFVKYADGNLVEVSAQDLAIDASKVDTSKAGKYKLAITYNGFTLNCEIEVVGIDSLKVRGGSVDKTVFVNGILDTSNLEAFLYYTDGEKFLITNDQLEITNINTSIVGVQQLKIAYKFVGTNIETTVETTYDIEVIGVKDIKIIDGTIKNEILKGKETFDPSNIKVSVTYTNDTHENKAFADLTLSAIDSTKAGEQKLTISYLDKSIEHTVKVCTVSSIRVEGVSKTIQAGGTVDLSNIKVYGVYDDSKETEIELKTGIDTDLVDLENGDKELTVSYDGEWGVFSTMIKISSQAPELTGITVTNYDKYVVIGGAAPIFGCLLL